MCSAGTLGAELLLLRYPYASSRNSLSRCRRCSARSPNQAASSPRCSSIRLRPIRRSSCAIRSDGGSRSPLAIPGILVSPTPSLMPATWNAIAATPGARRSSSPASRASTPLAEGAMSLMCRSPSTKCVARRPRQALASGSDIALSGPVPSVGSTDPAGADVTTATVRAPLSLRTRPGSALPCLAPARRTSPDANPRTMPPTYAARMTPVLFIAPLWPLTCLVQAQQHQPSRQDREDAACDHPREERRPHCQQRTRATA